MAQERPSSYLGPNWITRPPATTSAPPSTRPADGRSPNRTRLRDRAVRQFCSEREILYQCFSLLTANREVLRHRRVDEIASRTGRTVPQVIFRFALQVGMTALTGTTSAAHMTEDLGIYDFELQPDEIRTLAEVGA